MTLGMKPETIAVCAGAALLAMGCTDTSGPTAPLATEQPLPLALESANGIGDNVEDAAIYDFWATATGELELRTRGEEPYLRVEVIYRIDPHEPGQPGVFRFYGSTQAEARKHVRKGADFFATAKHDWKDGRDWYQAFRVLKCSSPA